MCRQILNLFHSSKKYSSHLFPPNPLENLVGNHQVLYKNRSFRRINFKQRAYSQKFSCIVTGEIQEKTPV